MPIDYSAAAPPKKAGARTPRAAKAAPPPPVDPKLARHAGHLSELRDFAAAALMMAPGMEADAGAVQLHTGPEVINAYAELAVEFEGFGNFLDKFDEVGGRWLKLAMVTLPLALQIGANHGFVKARGGPMNIMEPDLIAAQVIAKKADLARMAKEQAKAARAQAEEMLRQAATEDDEAA